jgi:hypothetical protein
VSSLCFAVDSDRRRATMSDEMTDLDVATIVSFRSDGFAVVLDVFSAEELDRFGAAVGAAVADDISRSPAAAWRSTTG